MGWLAEIFPLLYVVLALPAGVLLDRWFRPALAAGGALTALGGLVRLGGPTYAWAFAGQTLVAVAQPVVLSAVSKLAGQYLPVAERANGIAVGAGAGFVGMLLALLLGPTVGGGGHIERLLVVQAAIAAVSGLALVLALRARGHAGSEHAAIEGSAARALWRIPAIRLLGGLVFIGFGIFVALATWLQSLLEPQGVSEAAAGGLLVGMVLAGTIGCAVIPRAVERRHAERRFMLAVVVTAVLGCAALAALQVAARSGARARRDGRGAPAGAAGGAHGGRANGRRGCGQRRRDHLAGRQPRRSRGGAARAGPGRSSPPPPSSRWLPSRCSGCRSPRGSAG